MNKEALFWTKTARKGQCWEWQGARLNGGYGYFDGLTFERLVHRISWTLAKGAIPKGKWVLHTCDNRACINPKHLWLGTRLDNMQDAARKNRMSRQGRRKLTWKAVKAIRANTKLTQAQLGAKYGVTQSAIHYVLKGNIW